MSTASASLKALVARIDGGESDIALDSMTRSDSSAVAVLLAATRHAESTGRTIRFTGVPPSLASLVKLYGVEALVGAVPTA